MVHQNKKITSDSGQLIEIKNCILSANTGLDAIKRAPIVNYDTGVKCLRIQDISQNKHFDNWGFTLVEEQQYNKFQLKKDDIIIARTGETVGVNTYIGNDLKSVFNNGLIRIRVNEELCYPKFLYYNFRSKNFSRYIYNISRGTSTQPNIQINALLKFPIKLPSLLKQQQIASILSSLDNKIELLHGQNKTLEELAQTIFKQWFIDFNFPDENGNPYKISGGAMVNTELGKTPINWRVVELGSLVALNKGKSYKSSELSTSGLPMVNLKCFGRDYEFKHSGIKYFTGSYKDSHIVKGGDLVISMTDVTQNADIVANVLTIPSYLKEAIISLDVSSITSKNKNITNSFLYYLLKTNIFREFAKSYTSGTTVLHLNKNGILNYRFALPNDTILDKISHILHCIITQKDKNIAQHKTLAAIRDTLLPKLMSGEIKI